MESNKSPARYRSRREEMPYIGSPANAASSAPTPRSEPIPGERVLTEDFVGKQVQGAVITVPLNFTYIQGDTLEKAATDAGIIVYRSSSLSLSLLALREGPAISLACTSQNSTVQAEMPSTPR
ncbi:hypothetical protein EV360DRAFT_90684 [Lentinula raphanica]|nr:hypothetical protein EV360DRAFT_90684 [Lentinula raphanica]